MPNTKVGTGIAGVAGVILAAAALSGCTSSAQTSASGTTTTSSAGSAASSTSSQTTGTTSGSPTSDGGTTPMSTSGLASCTAAQLKVTETSDGAAGGHAAWTLVFTNVGSTSCSVTGYPGAGVTDKPGDVVLNATRTLTGYIGGGYSNPATIVLKPGSAASTVLEWIDAPPNGETPVGANCPGMDGGNVLVTPPNTQQSTLFPAPADLCTGFRVHPLVPGTSGRPAQ